MHWSLLSLVLAGAGVQWAGAIPGQGGQRAPLPVLHVCAPCRASSEPCHAQKDPAHSCASVRKLMMPADLKPSSARPCTERAPYSIAAAGASMFIGTMFLCIPRSPDGSGLLHSLMPCLYKCICAQEERIAPLYSSASQYTMSEQEENIVRLLRNALQEGSVQDARGTYMRQIRDLDPPHMVSVNQEGSSRANTFFDICCKVCCCSAPLHA